MSTDQQNPLAGLTFDTKEVPTLYSNHASPSISFNDIRIYFGEIFPKYLNAETLPAVTRIEPTIVPRLCVVVTPEFAKSLVDALSKAVEKYEEVFGPTRPQPSQEHVNLKLLPKQ